MKISPFPPLSSSLILILGWSLLAGCARRPEPIPTVATNGGGDAAATAGQALLARCVAAHGGRDAYERLRDVNVRYEGRWAAVGPRLQPKLSDTGYRGGSEERYLLLPTGFAVGQYHRGPKGEKWVFHAPGTRVVVGYQPRDADGAAANARLSDPDTFAAAALVIDAYSSFLFGPYFFDKRHAEVRKLAGTEEVNGRSCDEVLAILRPGLGQSTEDRVVLSIDQTDHLLRRVRFTLNGLESTRGAEVRVDLLDQRRLAGVWWPTRFYEHIERPVNLPAHRWRMAGFDSGRGYGLGDLAGTDNTGFKGRAAAPARDHGGCFANAVRRG